MSLLKSIKQQLGLGPAAENHFFDGSVPNQLTIKRGTPDAPGATVFQVVNGKATVLPTNQTWQNMSASRSWAVDYVNNTGLPITVSVIVDSVSGTNLSVYARIDGQQVNNLFVPSGVSGNTSSTLQVVVPVGATYRLEAIGANAVVWMELRS